MHPPHRVIRDRGEHGEPRRGRLILYDVAELIDGEEDLGVLVAIRHPYDQTRDLNRELLREMAWLPAATAP